MRYRCRSNRSMYDVHMPRLCHTMHKIFLTYHVFSFIRFVLISVLYSISSNFESQNLKREKSEKTNCTNDGQACTLNNYVNLNCNENQSHKKQNV